MNDPKITLDLQRLREAARLSTWGKTPAEFQAQQLKLVGEAFDHSDSLDLDIRTLAAGFHTSAGMLCAQAHRIDELAVYELDEPRR
jgi:hypothetical protein